MASVAKIMKIFITGISTDVGKTIASAIIVEALEADYWKPIQAGDLDNSDSHKIKSYISNNKTVIHENSYLLNTPASPHLAAQIDGITIDLKKITDCKRILWIKEQTYKIKPQISQINTDK